MMTKRAAFLAATAASMVMAVGVNVVDVPGSMVWFRRRTGGVGTLDTLPLAGAARVHELLTLLGADGRALYLREIALFDIAFPIALLAMVHLALVQVWPTNARRVLVLPWAAFVIDLVENTCAAVLTTTFPDESPLLADAIGWLTAAKFAAYAAGIVAVVVGVKRRGQSPAAPTAAPR